MAQDNLAERMKRILDMPHELFRISHFLSPPFFPVGAITTKTHAEYIRIGSWVIRAGKARAHCGNMHNWLWNPTPFFIFLFLYYLFQLVGYSAKLLL